MLEAYSLAERLPIAKHPEFRAITTHWLQTPGSDPLYGNRETAAKWRRVLSALASGGEKDWDGRPLRSFPRKKAKTIIAYDDVPFRPRANARFTFAEICAGIGGFRIALQAVGGKCVFSSELDDSARQTYFKNYGEYPFGDIKQFTNSRVSDDQIDRAIPNHHILAAGFPCQPFSKAGVSARNHLGQETGFACETQGTLFFDIIRVAQIKRPAVLFLENVKNLLTHDNKRTFDIIRNAIEDGLRYSFYSKVLDASSLVPQRRERCYMVCFRKRTTEFSFPRLLSDQLPLKSILEKKAESRYTISDKLWRGHKKRSRRNRARKTGFVVETANIKKPANTLIARYGKDGKECLIPQPGKNPRLLTPRECARLQGFPEEFVLPEQPTAAYRQFGNSVAIPVVIRITKRIITALNRRPT